jgi:hypothetical protein
MLIEKIKNLIENDFERLIESGKRELEFKFIKAGHIYGSPLESLGGNIINSMKAIEVQICELVKEHGSKQKSAFKKLKDDIDVNRSELHRKAFLYLEKLFIKGEKSYKNPEFRKNFISELSNVAHLADLNLKPILGKEEKKSIVSKIKIIFWKHLDKIVLFIISNI